MQKPILVLAVAKDPNSSLQTRIIDYLIDKKRLASLEGRDDVVLIGDRAILLDRITAHEIFVQVCAGLLEKGWSYLLLPLDSETCVACGTFPEKLTTILQSYRVPIAG